MTTTTDRIDRGIQERDARVSRAIKRGGLPTEVEVDAIDKAFQKAYDLLEAVASRVAGISEIENYSDAPPYTVTLDQIGLVAALASDVLDLDLDQMRREAERLRDAIGPLDTIRRQQQ
jgi:hypothetical protein